MKIRFSLVMLLSFVCIMVLVTKASCAQEPVTEASIESISIGETKTSFYLGNEFQLSSDFSVTAHYDDGTARLLSAEEYTADSSHYDKNTEGTYSIMIIYNQDPTIHETIEVSVSAAVVTALQLASDTLEYEVGHSFDPSDIRGNLVYADGSAVPFTANDIIISDFEFDPFTVSEHTVTVTYAADNSISASIQVNVIPATTLRVLMIGNSFSDDTIEWVPQMLQSMGVTDFEIGNLFIGGCSIDAHYNNAVFKNHAYEFRYYKNSGWITKVGNELKTMEYGIRFREWDIITVQQVSGLSGRPDTYSNLAPLVDYIKDTALNEDVKIVFNMTWAYQADSTHQDFPYYDRNQQTMYHAIINTVTEQVATLDTIDAVIPTGTAIQNARTSLIGDTLTRDGFHLSYDIGRYIAGLTLLAKLTGHDPTEVSFKFDFMDEWIIAAMESAANAITNPFSVTVSQYP